jgi:hypothetical protein
MAPAEVKIYKKKTIASNNKQKPNVKALLNEYILHAKR